MKKLLFSACVTGIVCAFFLSVAITIALLLIALGAVAIFSPLIVSTCRFNTLFYMGEMEEDIVCILDRAKKSLRSEGWLTFDQIFSLAETLNPNKYLPKNGYYIALSNLLNRKMVEAGSKNGEHFYRLIVECIPEKGKTEKYLSLNEVPCAA
ncbi:MAG: hypothetical protein UR60_C0021G0007 [Candidatus Moranbacteria bacterium GW2011_GWF2_34_56]|nr:MAG: hypothetical protein UR51_C0008G0026 [Candidatus Moranbacteria bacterium GW2011_GWF1_34_10]KKP64439.1 MAG: hypothetical protein UR60_C0021G0007 [Candidatus Moranbacteria bacterium GW2011_GWF2_34_56]HBI17087.1 hypothetical protein [Candidatus Moranbacteria bacterium]